MHVYEPHAPYRPPPPFDREYASQPYYGEVAAADAALGAAARRRARRRDGRRWSSSPAITARALGDHGEATHGLFAYESTLRVPLIIAELGRGVMAARARGRIRRNRPIDPARHVDILPTILDALGLPPPPICRATRCARAPIATAARAASYFEAMSSMLDYGWAPLDGVLVGREKYIALPSPSSTISRAIRAKQTT